MRLYVAVEFGSIERRKGVIMSEWAKRAAKRLYEREHKDELANAAMLEKRRLLQEQGLGLWTALRAKARDLCEELNMEVGRVVAVVAHTPSHELRVQLTNSEGMSELIASFRLEMAADAVQWKYAGPAAQRSRGGKYALIVEDGGTVLGDGRDRTTPDEVAGFMMDGLLP